MDLIAIAGDDLRLYTGSVSTGDDLAPLQSQLQAFGQGTTHTLRRLTVAVIGASGTGSIVIELLARLGVGRLILVDPDIMEVRNLNRVLNATMDDVRQGSFKVHVYAEAVEKMGFGTAVTALAVSLCNRVAVRAVAEADMVFGCMDGSEGRYVLNRLASFYNLPYFDVGVKLEADGHGGIDQVCGTVNYLQPDGSSLLSRRVITMAEVQAEGLRRTNPEEYRDRLKRNYIVGVQEHRPAVISVNMHYASLAVCELLARIHGFRDEPNRDYARYGSSLTQSRMFYESEGAPCPILARHAGRGDVDPLLDMPGLDEGEEAQ